MQGTWRAGLHAPPIVFINRLGSHADDVYAARTDAERTMQSAKHPHAQLAEVRMRIGVKMRRAAVGKLV